MRPADLALALFVVLIWGVNFVVIKLGVAEVPPLLLGALRFIAAALPAVFLFRRPRLPLWVYLAYGLTISVGQFALLFTAIHVGMPSGLASLVLQSQAFFTMVFAAWWLGEAWRPTQLLGLALAGAGLVLIGSAHGLSMPLAGFLLTVAAASMWAAGNIVTRAVSKLGQGGEAVDMQAFVVWACLVPPVPFLLLSWWLEGGKAIAAALSGFGLQSAFAVGYLAWMATLVGYGVWSRLLSRYPANQVAPFSLLVPLVGLSSGWLVFGERLQGVHFAGGALLMAGLALNLFGTRVIGWMRRTA
ncbi:MAG: EamA family transporter [Rhodocyclaceae bacterium]